MPLTSLARRKRKVKQTMKRILLASVLALGFLTPAAHAQMVNAQTGTTYTVANRDCDPQGRALLTFNNSGSVAVTLPQAGTGGQFASGCIINVENLGSGTVTITPTTSTINGATTQAIGQNGGGQIFNDGTNYIFQSGLSNAASGAASLASITGTASPFPITGLGAATGGALNLVGGASSTSATAGGNVNVTAGAGGATGAGGQVVIAGAAGQSTAAGGAVSLTGGASGPGATGNGGAATVAGGAATSTNGTGGQVNDTGGVGTGTGNGGAVVDTGGAGGATSGVGGAYTAAAGAGGGTGAGGVASVTGGASGAGATGNGGVGRVQGGAAASTNGTGGAVQAIGGAGTGTGAGGAVTITSGAGGTTGSGGAVNISAGAATGAAGAAVTISAGAGNGGTAAGGNINLVPGAAVSTGTPGNLQVNGNADLIYGVYYFTGTPAATNQVFFVANRSMLINSCSEIHSTAAGGASTLTVTHDTSTNTPGSGTTVQTGNFNLNATANTIQNATLSGTVATLKLAAGDRLAVVFANAIQSSAGVVVSCGMTPI
jgi:hypothetical protein